MCCHAGCYKLWVLSSTNATLFSYGSTSANLLIISLALRVFTFGRYGPLCDTL